MKYSIVTAANASYFPFLDILISTATEKCANLDSIYVIDSGLGKFKSLLSHYQNVKIISTGLVDDFQGVHSEGWRKATRSKTLGLIELYKQYTFDHTIILIDCDVAVIKDLGSSIDLSYDIQATVMSDGGHTRRDGIFIKEIASYACFNNHSVAQQFIKQWSATISYLEENRIDTPHETPSFNFTLRDYENNYNIGSLDENYVCSDLKIFDNTLSVHFKSNGSTKHDPVTNFFSRLRATKNFTSLKYDFEKYLNKHNFNQWLMTMAQQGNRRLTLEEFTTYIDNLSDEGEFSFGFNWVDYVQKTLSEPIIEIHQQDLQGIYSEANLDVRGLKVLDIGSGSGLSSLALLRLGAASVHSIDIDPFSVQASQLTKEKFSNSLENWSIEHKSVFDSNLGQYDLVYTWGVLHHTGNLSKAIDQAVGAVAEHGYLHVALYRSGPKFPEHLAQKQHFASLDRKSKIEYLYRYTGGNPYMFNLDNRGMNTFHDALDWLGGLPYEVCDPDELNQRLSNFQRIYFRDGGCGGNFVAVYKRVS
jgi:2-polyprenyl-3-methyl-5-hydroxy-6-metoxy-1,4-benzoquinol methylase